MVQTYILSTNPPSPNQPVRTCPPRTNSIVAETARTTGSTSLLAPSTFSYFDLFPSPFQQPFINLPFFFSFQWLATVNDQALSALSHTLTTDCAPQTGMVTARSMSSGGHFFQSLVCRHSTTPNSESLTKPLCL